MSRYLLPLLLLPLFGFTWTVFDEMRYSQFASPDWQHIDAEAAVHGTSAESPAAVSQYGSCNVSWAHLTYGQTYSCSLSAPGGWCRDVGIDFQRNSPGQATCTIAFPGEEPVSFIFAVALP